MRQRKNEVGNIRKQILVPKSLRVKVIEVARDSFVWQTFGSEKNGGQVLN